MPSHPTTLLDTHNRPSSRRIARSSTQVSHLHVFHATTMNPNGGTCCTIVLRPYSSALNIGSTHCHQRGRQVLYRVAPDAAGHPSSTKARIRYCSAMSGCWAAKAFTWNTRSTCMDQKFSARSGLSRTSLEVA